MTALLTVDLLKKELGYDRIVEKVRSYTLHDGSVVHLRDLEVHPADESLPCIYWVFDPGLRLLQQYGFGNWHGHFDDMRTDRGRVSASVRLTRLLMNHHYCVLEELRRDGDCRGAGVYRPTQIPKTLGKDIVQFRRMFFGRPGIPEPIDFSKYIEEEHIFIEKRHKAKIDRIQKQIADMHA